MYKILITFITSTDDSLTFDNILQNKWLIRNPLDIFMASNLGINDMPYFLK